MTTNGAPKKHMDISPGESPWAAMARELSSNPDSPASLKIMSAMSKAMAPRQRAINQVVDALEAQLLRDGEQEAAAVTAAISYWERERNESMPPDILADMRRDAQSRINKKERQPPPMETILASQPALTDTGYKLGVHMEGLEGTWHRLWGIVALTHSFGRGAIDDDEGVKSVRGQFERVLGRALSRDEWKKLCDHAIHHADTHMSQPPRD